MNVYLVTSTDSAGRITHTIFETRPLADEYVARMTMEDWTSYVELHMVLRVRPTTVRHEMATGRIS